VLKNNKLIIFTESKETGDYLEKQLSDNFGGKVMLYSSSGGVNGDTASSATIGSVLSIVKTL
jgi:delta 1-pyrroline-5-carboxylate dehydrogenase